MNGYRAKAGDVKERTGWRWQSNGMLAPTVCSLSGMLPSERIKAGSVKVCLSELE